MAEGPIRRACNRCHAQKLSCKRVGNEPCERCVRLKAECKSSPSLRFRKPSSSTSSSGSKSSNRHTMSSHRDQITPNCPNLQSSHATDFAPVEVPYPGPYSFDGMAEHLWPAHSVDAGLLIYRPDGNQIYQTLPPSQIPFLDGPNRFHGDGYLASAMDTMDTMDSMDSMDSMESSLTSRPMAAMAPGTMFPMPDPVSSPWVLGDPDLNTSWNAESCSGISIAHMPQHMYRGIEVQSTMAPVMGNLSTCQSYDSRHIEVVDKNVLSSTAAFGVQDCTSKCLDFQHDCTASVSKALFAELCAVSTRLLGLGSSMPAASELLTASVEPTPSVMDGNLLKARVSFPRKEAVFPGLNDNRHNGGSLSARSSNSSFRSRPFPMDNLFALSQKFIETVHSACHTGGNDLTSSRHDHDHGSTSNDHAMSDCPPFARISISGTNSTAAAGSERIDAGSFVVLAGSTYTALLDVYQGVFHLVHATAKSAQPPSPATTSDGSYGTNEGMRHPLRNASTALWKEATAQACLNVCRFPDVSVGGFSIASTPALQLGLGLRLADNFLTHFSHAMASLHMCFSGRGGDDASAILGHAAVSGSVAATASAEASNSSTSTTDYLPQQPPLVFSDDFYTTGGMDTGMAWDTATATSVSSSSTTDLLFSPQDGLVGTRPMDDVMARESQLRHDLASLRSSLSC